jgi:CRISPR-associated endonuclease/helicase Cas3
VALRLWPGIDDPVAIAAEAAAAAHAGAKVLVVRNTRRAAIGTFLALRACAPEAPVLACNGVPTLHHGRFAREDRARLDAALEAGIGKERPGGGLVVIGTQTLEQSLDIDADLIITDLCPADVLLQRIGRLHRHHGRTRPPGFEEPRALILSPPALAPLIERPAHGLGASEAFAGPYPDLVGLEATRRLVALEPVWTIPAMNRRLVEMTTHPQALAALGEDLVSTDAAWRAATNRNGGRCFAHVSQASGAILRTDCGFGAPPNVFSSDDAAATRLGARDLLIELAEPVAGPFGAPVSGFALPDYWCGRIEAGGDLTARVTREAEGRLRLEIQGVAFAYDALGLRLARP